MQLADDLDNQHHVSRADNCVGWCGEEVLKKDASDFDVLSAGGHVSSAGGPRLVCLWPRLVCLWTRLVCWWPRLVCRWTRLVCLWPRLVCRWTSVRQSWSIRPCTERAGCGGGYRRGEALCRQSPVTPAPARLLTRTAVGRLSLCLSVMAQFSCEMTPIQPTVFRWCNTRVCSSLGAATRCWCSHELNDLMISWHYDLLLALNVFVVGMFSPGV